MSDYVHTKAIMYPLGDGEAADNLCKSLGAEDRWELERLKPELFERVKGKPYFEIEVMVNNWEGNYYLSYVLYYEYGADCGDFGRNRFLSLTEQEKYKKIFEQVIPNIDPSKLKYVDYCYYNCCESEDYYIKEDEFNIEI